MNRIDDELKTLVASLREVHLSAPVLFFLADSGGQASFDMSQSNFPPAGPMLDFMLNLIAVACGGAVAEMEATSGDRLFAVFHLLEVNIDIVSKETGLPTEAEPDFPFTAQDDLMSLYGEDREGNRVCWLSQIVGRDPQDDAPIPGGKEHWTFTYDETGTLSPSKMVSKVWQYQLSASEFFAHQQKIEKGRLN